MTSNGGIGSTSLAHNDYAGIIALRVPTGTFGISSRAAQGGTVKAPPSMIAGSFRLWCS